MPSPQPLGGWPFFHTQIGALYWQLQQDLLAGNYTPVTSFAAERCDLPPPALEAQQQQQGRVEL